MNNAFYFILKTFVVLKILNFLSSLFGHVEKTVWLERKDKFQNLSRHNLVHKQLQYTDRISSIKRRASIGASL